MPATSARAQQLDPVLTGLDSPAGFVSWPGNSGVLLVAERGRAVIEKYILQPPGLPPLATTFLDLSSKAVIITTPVGDFDGVTGLEFHPEFLNGRNNRYFYVRYNRKFQGAATDLDMVIERYEVPPGWGVADPSTGVVMFEQEMETRVHSAGQIHFDVVDSSLMYCATGDDVAPNAIGGQGVCDCLMVRCQDPASHLGKLMVFDVDDAPPWNPIHLAKGLRNPFMFSVDRGDPAGVGKGDVWVGTTGGLTTGDIFRWQPGAGGCSTTGGRGR